MAREIQYIDGDAKGGNMRDEGACCPQPEKFDNKEYGVSPTAKGNIAQEEMGKPTDPFKGSPVTCSDECSESKLDLSQPLMKDVKIERF